MHARLAAISIGGEEDASVAEIMEQVVPTIRELDGYRGFVLLNGLEGDRFLVLTLWDSAEAMEASESVAARIMAAETATRDFELEGMTQYRVDSFDLSR